MIEMKLTFGNTFSEIKKGDFTPNRWALFLTLDNNKNITEKYIKYVNYSLPPLYKDTYISTKEHPFMLSRVAY
jgi:hypothetical protein